jgi:hypothetical protein
MALFPRQRIYTGSELKAINRKKKPKHSPTIGSFVVVVVVPTSQQIVGKAINRGTQRKQSTEALDQSNQPKEKKPKQSTKRKKPKHSPTIGSFVVVVPTSQQIVGKPTNQ